MEYALSEPNSSISLQKSRPRPEKISGLTSKDRDCLAVTVPVFVESLCWPLTPVPDSPVCGLPVSDLPVFDLPVSDSAVGVAAVLMLRVGILPGGKVDKSSSVMWVELLLRVQGDILNL